MTQIVTVNVSQQVASAPRNLQQTGAFVSQGATNQAVGSVTLLTQLSDLTALLKSAINIVSMTWSGGVVTVTTASAHGIPVGAAETISATIIGAIPTAYSGTFAATATSTTVFTFPLASNPGAVSTLGTFELYAVQETLAMATTFFAQQSSQQSISSYQAIYLLELGCNTPAAGVTALTAYITNPTKQMYAYLLPSEWDTEPTAKTMAAQYEGTTASLYFYVTTTISTYSGWMGIKSVFATLQSPSAPVTEFSAAAIFFVALVYSPNPTNLLAPMSYRYVYSVTAYTGLTNTQTVAIADAGANYIGTGAEGGISNTLVMNGQFADKNTFNYWYAVDWAIINIGQSLSAAVINGSNNPTNPLYYNQAGINRLQKVAQNTVNSGISYGMILSPATVTATPFSTYIAANPSDYSIGKYSGLALTFTPSRGFTSIVVNLTASNIPV